MMKISTLLKEISDSEKRKFGLSEKKQFIDMVREYQQLSAGLEGLYESIFKLKKINELVDLAEGITLQETEEWFDQFSVKRDMKSMREACKHLDKTVDEINSLHQRAQSLYEEIGFRLGKYYKL